MLGNLSRGHGNDGVSEVSQAKNATERASVEAPSLVLRREPDLGCREEEGRADARHDAAQEKHVEEVGPRGDGSENVKESEANGPFFAAPAIHHFAYQGPEQGCGAEAHEEELADRVGGHGHPIQHFAGVDLEGGESMIRGLQIRQASSGHMAHDAGGAAGEKERG